MERRELREIANQIVSGKVVFDVRNTIQNAYGYHIAYRAPNASDRYCESISLTRNDYAYFLSRLRIESNRAA